MEDLWKIVQSSCSISEHFLVAEYLSIFQKIQQHNMTGQQHDGTMSKTAQNSMEGTHSPVECWEGTEQNNRRWRESKGGKKKRKKKEKQDTGRRMRGRKSWGSRPR